MRKKLRKNFFIFEIITSELIALNCLFQEENTCHRHSVCYQTILRFFKSLTETFFKTIVIPVINKYGKGGVLQILTISTDPLKYDFLGIHLIMFFGVGNLGHTSAMGVIFFLKMFQL